MDFSLNINSEINELKNIKWTENIAKEFIKDSQVELKDSFGYDCPIETNKSSTESNNVGSFIFSFYKIMQTGFRPNYGGKEIRSLLEQCKMKRQLVVH